MFTNIREVFPCSYLPKAVTPSGSCWSWLRTTAPPISKAGLVDGLRGKGGGYRLNRPAADYSVGQILRLTEGSLAPVTCLEGDENTCPRAGHCTTLPMWEKLDTIINDYLDSVSLADLLTQTDGGAL